MTVYNELEVRKIIMELGDEMDVRKAFEAAAKLLESQVGYSSYDYQGCADVLREIAMLQP